MFKPALRHCVKVSDGWVGVLVGVGVGVRVGVGVEVAVAVGVGVSVGQAYITKGIKTSNISFRRYSSNWNRALKLSLVLACDGTTPPSGILTTEMLMIKSTNIAKIISGIRLLFILTSSDLLASRYIHILSLERRGLVYGWTITITFLEPVIRPEHLCGGTNHLANGIFCYQQRVD
jgi:hypothetical protein